MSGNTFGKILRLTTYGESHGFAIGGILDGYPSNIPINFTFIQAELNRRMPGKTFFSTPRKEEDRIDYFSGIFNGQSTGTPISFFIYNHDQKPEDYSLTKDFFRPSHADYTYQAKYGIRDYRGGGRASARESVARVAGGAFAKLLLMKRNIRINGYVSQIGTCKLPDNFVLPPDFSPENTVTGCPDPGTEAEMIRLLEILKAEGDTTGGVISCIIQGTPPGLGEPVFDKIQADLAKAMMSINAVKGFEYGSGFASASMKGSVHNDPFIFEKGRIATASNYSGGVQGGITNGEEIQFRVAFKPVATIMKDQKTVKTTGEESILHGRGRHDVCVVPRAVVIVEAMASLVIADHLLQSRL